MSAPLPEDDADLDRERVSELTSNLMHAIKTNYARGPMAKERALEALNALASASAIVVSACDGMGGVAEKFLYRALTMNLKHYCGRGKPPPVSFDGYEQQQQPGPTK
jgi:hypothetical protein